MLRPTTQLAYCRPPSCDASSYNTAGLLPTSVLRCSVLKHSWPTADLRPAMLRPKTQLAYCRPPSCDAPSYNTAGLLPTSVLRCSVLKHSWPTADLRPAMHVLQHSWPTADLRPAMHVLQHSWPTADLRPAMHVLQHSWPTADLRPAMGVLKHSWPTAYLRPAILRPTTQLAYCRPPSYNACPTTQPPPAAGWRYDPRHNLSGSPLCSGEWVLNKPWDALPAAAAWLLDIWRHTLYHTLDGDW